MGNRAPIFKAANLMIISHQHRFIFFAIPKTGTHSVRQALRTQLGTQDLEQVGLFVEKRFPFKEFANITHGHISTQQIRPVLGEYVFKRYYKFAFVRNPYDRFVSYCAFMGREDNEFEAAPRDFMKHIVKNRNSMDHLLYRPQHEFITDAEGHLAVDFIGRTEDMQASYDAICARLELPPAALGCINTSRHRPYVEYYDAELRNAVATVYRRDLELFNYEFDASARA